MARRTNGRAAALGPANREYLVVFTLVRMPADVDMTQVVGKRAIFRSVCRQLMDDLPSVCAAATDNRNDGPLSFILLPMRSLKCASWTRMRSEISMPCHRLFTSKSWLAAKVCIRSEKRATNSSGLAMAVCLAIA